jgi:hypothetical protein
MEGMSSNFAGTNAAMLQMSNFGNIPQQGVPSQQQQQPNQAELPPQKKAVFERLKKRVNMYRKRQTETIPRFEQTFNGICEQQSVETNLLQKKFLESKAKRVAKKVDKKQGEVVGGATVVSFRNFPNNSHFKILNFRPKSVQRLTILKTSPISSRPPRNSPQIKPPKAPPWTT